MGIQLTWNDARRVLTLRLVPGLRMLPPLRRQIEVKLFQTTRLVEFVGNPVEASF
jgi:hypothetical protein